MTVRGSEWTTIIRPHRGSLDIRAGELWRCRDLISLFVWRDFVAAYKQTILGPLWHILQPLLTTIAFTIIFSRVAGLSTDGVSAFLFYMAGNVVWMYFAACLTKTANTFVGHATLFGKVYFHRLAVPISIVISNLIAFAIQLAMFLTLLGIWMMRGESVRLTLWALLLPLYVVLLAGLGLGFGMIVAALTTRYRDLLPLVMMGTQLWMYATPVIYPTSAVPERYRWLVTANPVTSLVEGFRMGFLGVGTISPGQLAYSAAFTALVIFAGILVFNRVEQTFMDTV